MILNFRSRPDPTYGVPTVYVHFLKLDQIAWDHPQAAKKTLAFPGLLRIHSTTPQIIGDVVSVVSERPNTDEHSINVIQWKTGIVLMVRQFPPHHMQYVLIRS